jgi:L-ascorbate metabolism protein UlaG (beta-lactamase superfamily)
MPKNIAIGDVDIEWLGHASFRLRADNKVIYIDPFKIPGGEKADIILITHDHYDHFDPGSINSIKKPDTLIIAPESCSSKVPDIRAVKPGDVVSVKDVEIKAVHAYNIGKPYHPKGSGVGFVVKIAGKTIYHAGDTDRVPEMENLKNIDVALLPAGGTYTMNAEEAAEAANAIKPAIAIPMHWGKIIGSKEDAIKFKNLCKVNVKVLD